MPDLPWDGTLRDALLSRRSCGRGRSGADGSPDALRPAVSDIASCLVLPYRCVFVAASRLLRCPLAWHGIHRRYCGKSRRCHTRLFWTGDLRIGDKGVWQSWRLGIDRKSPGSLVTTGIFAWTRNPIYVAFDLLAIGTLLLQGRLIFLVLAAIIVLVVHELICREERFLSEQYGHAYRDYRARVKITDAGLAELTGLSDLRELSLSDTSISDEGLKHIGGLSNLRWLEVTGTRVTRAGLNTLSEKKTSPRDRG
ncbi:MAG: methyltransferase family protein [Pirellulaceae bacterium]